MEGPITTHLIDTSLGRPAAGVPVRLELRLDDGAWQPLSTGETDTEGRAPRLLPAAHRLAQGVYRLTFDTSAYFRSQEQAGFFPYISIVFEVRRAGERHHVPVSFSPFGYCAHRGN